MRVVFFGTPRFAVPSLAALVDAGFDVSLAVTRPDRRVGRHAEMRPSPVAVHAAGRGIPATKPERVRGNEELLRSLREARPDAIAVVAFGRILPAEILSLPRLGAVNVHASLLPRYRGASPIQAAILAGDRETGVVTMQMEQELDAGPLYLERRLAIGEKETAGELSERLAAAGAGLLVETLDGLAGGSLAAQAQRGEPSFCGPIRRGDAEVDWNRRAEDLERQLRAYTPWPGLFTHLEGERIKILEAEVWKGSRSGEPGRFTVHAGELVASAGEGTALRLTRLQRSGRRPVTGQEFARAARLPGRFQRAP